MMKPILYCLAAASCGVFSPALHAEENWNQFRGPLGTGHSADKNVPVKWDKSSIIWKCELLGEGQSSPVNWGDKLFLTSSSKDGATRHVVCVDRNKGAILWRKQVAVAKPETPHRMNSFATSSCAITSDRVLAFFGPGGLHCYDHDGNIQWSETLGDFPGPWGVAASPIIVGDLVIQNCDTAGPSKLVAFDIGSGKERWSSERVEKPKGGWSTPILIKHEAKQELVLNGEFGVRSYDPKTGKELWFCKGFNGRGTPVPDFANGLVYVVNGKPGDCYAVTPGGSGDVTESKMKFHAKRRGGRDLASPVAVGDYLFVTSMSGVGTLYDSKSGDPIWEERLDGDFAASPMVANGLIYLQTVSGGETLVIKPGKELEIVSRNSLGTDKQELFRATLAPIEGQLFTRSASVLYCIGGK
ncbi:MAG: outer membrane protein assembly factor BamB [Pseudoalteromonas tetraodonis]|jgi:outer membrane protein assembly factor BamB